MCASRGRVVIPPRAPDGTRERFEDSTRWVRGRIVAALAGGDELPGSIPQERLGPALDALVRDRLVVVEHGAARLA